MEEGGSFARPVMVPHEWLFVFWDPPAKLGFGVLDVPLKPPQTTGVQTHTKTSSSP